MPTLRELVRYFLYLGTLGRILWFFAKAGTVVFGSGLAIVPFLYGGVVQEYAWRARP